MANPQQTKLDRQYQMGRQQLIDMIVPLMRQEPDPEDEVRPRTVTPEIFEGMNFVLNGIHRLCSSPYPCK
jgi:hypothetical protein